MRLITVVVEMREWVVLRVTAEGGLIGCSVGGLFHRPQYRGRHTTRVSTQKLCRSLSGSNRNFRSAGVVQQNVRSL